MSKSAIQRGEKAFQAVGDCIRQSELIVIGEYRTEGRIAVKDVLKGDKTWVGKTLELKTPILMGCREQPVPSIKSTAVLLRSNWQKDANPVVEVYDRPDELAMLRCLTPILGKPSEHDRLVAFSEMYVDPKAHCTQTFEGDPQPVFKQEFLSALKDMREPANFEIATRLYANPKVDDKDKLALLQWIADTGDVRAIPILQEALKSKDRFLSSDAATKLMYFYPGAATVAKPVPPQTPFQRAETLDREGKHKEAAAMYAAIAESKESNGYVVRASMLKALDHADAAVRARLVKARLGWLQQDAIGGNYLEVADTAEILRRLRDEPCAVALMAILSRREFMFAKADRCATMAIVELGPTARAKASAALLKEIGGTTALANNTDEQTRLLLELAWIGQTADRAAAGKLVSDQANWSAAWRNVQPLMDGARTADEGLFLIGLMREPKSLSPEAIDWIVYRLGDLHERRAADVLLTQFQKAPGYTPPTVSEALQAIGGEQITRKLDALALDPHSPVQPSAIDVLANIQHEKCLPTLRKVLRSGNTEAKMHAINALARFGTSADLQLLMPMSDYWKGDRANHYWLMQAIAGIRDRTSK